MNITGSIITVEDFFTNKENTITINGRETIKLQIDRKYVVPKYQREIRWKESHMTNLLKDITNSDIFLGNIILSKKDNVYDIIDGQQRITSIYMIIHFVMNKYNGLILNMIDKICELSVYSFESFNSILSKKFEDSLVTKEEILKDLLVQINSYKELWNTIELFDPLNDLNKASSFFDKLLKSKINLVVSESQKDSENINYFLDVNVKAVPLDDEDVFKGTFLKLTKKDNLINLENWFSFKKTYIKLQSLPSFADKRYTIITLLEQYFRYFFLVKIKKDEIKFDSRLILIEDFSEMSLTKNTHVLQTLNIIQVETCLQEIKDLSDFLFMIADNEEAPQSTFKDVLKSKPNVTRIDDVELNLIYKMLRFVTLNRDKVLKIFVIYYYFQVFKNQAASKNDVKLIYTIHYYSIIFSLLSKNKTGNVYNLLSNGDIESSLLTEAQTLLQSNPISKSVILRNKAFSNIEDTDNFLTKGLSLIYNYYNIYKNNKYNIALGNKKKMYDYLTDFDRFSTEHFIISKSKKYVENGVTKSYIKEEKENLNSILNFIFIPSSLNADNGNLSFSEKLNVYHHNLNKIDCNFSKEYLKALYRSKSEFEDMSYSTMLLNDKYWGLVTNIYQDLINSLIVS